MADDLSSFVFLQPKAELDDLIPTDNKASSRLKFQPKAKPRPQAKSRPSKLSLKQEQAQKQVKEPHQEERVVLAKQEPIHDDSNDYVTVIADQSAQGKKPKLEDSDDYVTVIVDQSVQGRKPKLEADVDSQATGIPLKSEAEEDIEPNPDPLRKDETESAPGSPSFASTKDHVVHEIDVFLCPTIDSNTQLYLLQYPLRPHWRPYNLEESCDQVRVKQNQSKIELDLVIDTDGENYDRDAAEHLLIKKQTLSSSKTTLATNYAVGFLRGNKLYLTPLHSVVQLRPSMKYLDDADAKKQQARKMIDDKDEDMADAADESEEESEEKPQLVAVKVEVKKQETERQEQWRLQSYAYLKQLDEAEPWIQLEPHGVDSPITDGIRHMITSTARVDIPFTMPRTDYIKYLVPSRANTSSLDGTIQEGNGEAGLSRSFLDTLPLEQRLETLLSKGRVHVLQFERLLKLAPTGCSEEELLSVLQDMALLVQGCWVVPSQLRYSGPICIVRDYVLFLFTRNRVISHESLDELQVPREMIREVLLPLAVQRPPEGGWEFLESTDRSFIKRHQGVVKAQNERWTENGDHIKDAALSLKLGAAGHSSSAPAHCAQIPFLAQGQGQAKSEGFSGQWTMSEDTRAALPGSLREIFGKHSVCSLNFLRQSLREMAITKASAPNANSKVVATAVAAAKGASAPPPEFNAAISHVASNIDGKYFLSKLNNPAIDPFRDVVITLLRGKGPQAGLRRQDIVEASKIQLKAEVQPAVYSKVMKELCYTKGGVWVMKPGDGRPA